MLTLRSHRQRLDVTKRLEIHFFQQLAISGDSRQRDCKQLGVGRASDADGNVTLCRSNMANANGSGGLWHVPFSDYGTLAACDFFFFF